MKPRVLWVVGCVCAVAAILIFVQNTQNLRILSETIRFPLQEISVEEFLKKTPEQQEKVVREKSAQDPVVAWNFLIAVNRHKSINTVRDMHTFGHIVGEALYAAYGMNGIGRCTSDLWEACYHGFMLQATLATRGTEGIVALAKACETAFAAQELTVADEQQRVRLCAHGIGHGLSSMHAPDTLAALSACSSFSDVVQETENPYDAARNNRSACARGVFMELLTVHSIPEDSPEKLWGACDTFPAIYLGECANKVGIGVATRSPEQIVEFCSTAPDEAAWYGCLDEVVMFYKVVNEFTQERDFAATQKKILKDFPEACAVVQDNAKRYARCLSVMAGTGVVFSHYAQNSGTLQPELLRAEEAARKICAPLPASDAAYCVAHATDIQDY